VDKSPFQYEAQVGVVAAVLELLVQSHVPGQLHLLPALPREIAEKGYITGVAARGDMRVSLIWQKGLVAAAVIIVRSIHPWHSHKSNTDGSISPVLQEGPSGYFSLSDRWKDSLEISFVMASPGPLRLLLSNKLKNINKKGKKSRRNFKRMTATGNSCAQMIGEEKPTLAADPTRLHNGVRILVSSTPCQLLICGDEVDDKQCNSMLKMILEKML